MPAVARIGPLVLSLAVAACGSSALGYEQAPASLDERSPTVAAVNVAFDRNELSVPANVPFILVFENREAVSHNVSIYADAAGQRRLLDGVVFSGPATRWYPVPALTPGRYLFRCDVHPNMTGEVIAS